MLNGFDIQRARWGLLCKQHPEPVLTDICPSSTLFWPMQHPDACGVSVHPECTGMPFPTGNYICANHDNGELKARIGRRRRASTARRGDEEADLGDVLSDETEDEETEDEEGGGGGGGAGARSGGSGGGTGKKKADSDSEATVSEATASLDSSATEDEGTTSKRRRKR